MVGWLTSAVRRAPALTIQETCPDRTSESQPIWIDNIVCPHGTINHEATSPGLQVPPGLVVSLKQAFLVPDSRSRQQTEQQTLWRPDWPSSISQRQVLGFR